MLSLASCVFIPKTVTYYDQDCKIELKRMELNSKEMKMGSMGHCKDEACIINLLIPGIIAAGSAVVSGSIVVTGNTVYWLEKQVKCM